MKQSCSTSAFFTATIISAILLSGACNTAPQEGKKGTADNAVHIPVSNDDPSKFAEIDSLIESCEVIPLETTDQSLFGSINALYAINDRIIIFDKYNSKSILIFTKDGKYVNRISPAGQGPGEFSSILRCTADENGIEVFDAGLSKILRYSTDGAYKTEFRLKPFYKTTFTKYGPGKYLFYNAGEPVINGAGYKLIAWDVEKNQRESLFFPFDKRLAKCKAYIDEQHFVQSDGNTTFFELFNDTIYSFNHSNLTVSPRYIIDFKRRKLPPAFVNNHKILDKLKEANNNIHAIFTGRLMELSNYLFFKYNYRQSERSFVWDKVHNKAMANSHMIGLGGMDIPILNWHKGFQENQLVVKMESYELLEWLSEKKRSGADLSSNPLVKIAGTLKADHNPVLIFLNLKKSKV